MGRLSLDDLAAIASAPEGTRWADLARQLGRPYITVAVAAWRMRRAGGWLCRLTWRTCPVCRVPLASGQGSRRVHPQCVPAREHLQRQRRWQPRSRAGTWARLSPEQRAGRIASSRQRIRRDQALTSAAATRAGAPWTADDDAYLLGHWAQLTRDQALALGRTFWSVCRRRSALAHAAARDDSVAE